MSDDTRKQLSLDEVDSEDVREHKTDDAINTALDEATLGDIPTEWNSKRLEEVTNESLYGVAESAEDFDPNQLRYIRITDISDEGFLKESDKKSLSRKDIDKKYLLQPDQLLFARSGATVGKTYLYSEEDPEAVYGGYLIRFVPDTEQVLPEYLFYFTKSDNYDNWVTRVARQGAQKNINAKEYSSILFPLPSFEEQRKIATVLHTVDQAIQKTEEIIHQKETVKQGLLQDIFRYGLNSDGEVRQAVDSEPYEDTKYGTVPEGWDIVSLNNLVPNESPITYGIVKPGDHHPGGVPVVKVENIMDGRIDDDDLLHTDPEIHEKYKRAELQSGDLLFTIRGTVGRMAFVPDNLEGGNLTQDTARIRVENANPRFVRYYLETATPNNYFERHTKGQVVQGINLEDLREVPVHLPAETEQNRIVEILDSHTEQIQTDREYLNQLRRLKQGLMQDLFSGEVRTADRDINIHPEVEKDG